jgi:hypothetical protein
MKTKADKTNRSDVERSVTLRVHIDPLTLESLHKSAESDQRHPREVANLLFEWAVREYQNAPSFFALAEGWHPGDPY